MTIISILAIDVLTFCWVRRVYEILYKINLKLNGWVLFIDLDELKEINDRMGHGKGDEVLRKIGKILIKKSFFSAFRFGGDEFVVLGFFRDKEFLKKIVKSIEKIGISFSYGIAKAEQEADEKMYYMKKNKDREH